MGTRGFVGFVANEKETIVYNQYDSYPGGLGIDCLEFARTVNSWDVPDPWSVVKTQAANLVHVDESVKPTEEQVFHCAPWTNLNVSERSVDDWYCLLRETHGNPGAILSSGHAVHMPDWPTDSLFCEWGYVFNMDTGTFEVYEGFQQSPHKQGRFANRGDVGESGYYPVRRVATFVLRELPSDADFLAIENDDDDVIDAEVVTPAIEQ